jgi:hypothetical protein
LLLLTNTRTQISSLETKDTNHSGEGLGVGQAAVQETQNPLLPCKSLGLGLELRWKPDPYLITVSRHAAHPYITNAPYLIRLEHVQDDAIVRVGEVGVGR